MPVEIKELHIRINVDERTNSSDSQRMNREKQDKLVALCVEQVMEILEKKKER